MVSILSGSSSKTGAFKKSKAKKAYRIPNSTPNPERMSKTELN